MIRYRIFEIVVALNGILFFVVSLADAASPVWKEGQGEWTDAARWGGTATGPRASVSIEGDSKVADSGRCVHQPVGYRLLSQCSCHHDDGGGTLTVSKLLRIGETTNAAGRFIQTGGSILALQIIIGGANIGDGTDRNATADFEVRGGGILTRHLSLAWGMGSTARLRMVGSEAAPLLVLDYLWIGSGRKTPRACAIELSYDIDAGGVTPIVVWNKEASSVALIDEVAKSTCRLRISLRDAPPLGDIPLIRLPKPCRGTFTDLPEGSVVRAKLGNEAFEWTLTYRGGPGKTDVVLTHPHKVSPDGRLRPQIGETCEAICCHIGRCQFRSA